MIMKLMTGWLGTSRVVPSLFWLLVVGLGGVVPSAHAQSNPPPRLGLAVNSNGAGPFSLTLTGAPGATYLIQHAPQLPMPATSLGGVWTLLPPEMRESLTPSNHWKPHHFRTLNASNGADAIQVQPVDGARFYRALEYTGAVEQVTFLRRGLPQTLSDSFNVAWIFTNDAPGWEQRVRLIGPGSGIPSTNALGTSPAPGGTTFYLAESGQWVTTETSLAGFGGLITNRLPELRAGAWQLEIHLRDAATGQWGDAAALRFLVDDSPALTLEVSREIAGGADPVAAKLTLTAGSSPWAVELRTWLILPDGSQFGLPSFAPGLPPLYTGPSTNAQFTLFQQAFTNEGVHRVEARLTDATGQLLGLARREFTVCLASNLMATGTVWSASGTLLGAGAGHARVRAHNLDQPGWTRSAPITAGGAFAVELPPGRYSWSAVVQDGAGTHETTNRTLLRLDCAATNISLVLTTAPPWGPPGVPVAPVAATVKNAAAKSIQPPPDGLPAPTVLVRVGNDNRQALARQQQVLAHSFVDDLQQLNPYVTFIDELAMNEELAAIAARQIAGTDTAADADRITSQANLSTDFILSVTFYEEYTTPFDNWGPRALARMLDRCALALAWGDSLQLPFGTGFDFPEMTSLAQMCTTGAGSVGNSSGFGGFAGLRARQCRPIQPFVSLSLSAQSAAPNGTITATATVREGHAGGAVQPGQTVRIIVERPDGSTAAVPRTTDAQGQAQYPFAVGGLSPNLGSVRVEFLRNNQVQALSSMENFRVQDPALAALTLSSPQAQVNVGDLAPITLTLTRPAGAGSGANIPVRLTAHNAELAGPLGNVPLLDILTGSGPGDSGLANISLVGGQQGGVARVNATCTVTNNGVPQTLNASLLFFVDAGVESLVFANPSETRAGFTSRVVLETRIHGARVPGLPVSFALIGDGQLANASAVTDASGRAEVVFTAPTSPDHGAATVSATVTINQVDYANSTVVNWVPPPACDGYSNSTYCIQMVATNAELMAINDLGQVLYRRGNNEFFLWKQGVVTASFTDIPPIGGDYSGRAAYLNNRGEVASWDALGGYVVHNGSTNRLPFKPIHLDDEGWTYAVVATNQGGIVTWNLKASRDGVETVVDTVVVTIGVIDGTPSYYFVGRTGTLLRKWRGAWTTRETFIASTCEYQFGWTFIPGGCNQPGGIGGDLWVDTVPTHLGGYDTVYSLISRNGSRQQIFVIPPTLRYYNEWLATPAYDFVVMNSQREMMARRSPLTEYVYVIGQHPNVQTVPPTTLPQNDWFILESTFNLNSQGDAAYFSWNVPQQSGQYWQRKSGVFQQIPIPDVPGWTPMKPSYRNEGYRLFLNDNGQIALKTEREVAPGQFETALWLLTPLPP